MLFFTVSGFRNLLSGDYRISERDLRGWCAGVTPTTWTTKWTGGQRGRRTDWTRQWTWAERPVWSQRLDWDELTTACYWSWRDRDWDKPMRLAMMTSVSAVQRWCAAFARCPIAATLSRSESHHITSQHNHIISKSQDYGDVSARYTTRAPNNMQKPKIEKLKGLGKDECFQLAFESVNGMNSTKWWRQLVPGARSGHSERAVTESIN